MESTPRAEYELARKQGLKEVAECESAGRPTAPLVLDDLLPNTTLPVQDLGVMDIPMKFIVGTKAEGRIYAFSPSFHPILPEGTEFAQKWINLCGVHLGETGFTEPIECYEYLGQFFVQEGNKRLSVLRHFDATEISAHVRRVMPVAEDTAQSKAYFEFLDFYKLSKLYIIRFRKPGHYTKLMELLGYPTEEPWTQEQRRTFRAYYQYFLDALKGLEGKKIDILPEEALLLWLQVYSYQELGTMTATELKKSVVTLRDDLLSSQLETVNLQTRVDSAAKSGVLDKLFSAADDGLRIAFVHQLYPENSLWTRAHDKGRQHLESVFGSKIQVKSYFGAATPELAQEAMEAAIQEGARVVFTTAPTMALSALKIALKYPKVEVFNCSANQHYSSVRSYYARIYEGKFLTGAIAGAMAQDDRIGYIAAYPIHGEPGAINAFALGAQLTNPEAKIELRWSSLAGNPQTELFDSGIRIISNREIPPESSNLTFSTYGTYRMDETGALQPLGSPVWVWGKFYEYVVRSMFSGSFRYDKSDSRALNYYLGLDSGVIDVELSDKLPTGVATLAAYLRRGMLEGVVDPFCRKIIDQEGNLRNDGTKTFTPEEILNMDWLCENVVGRIPAFEELLPMAQPLVRQMGFDEEPGGDSHADSDCR